VYEVLLTQTSQAASVVVMLIALSGRMQTGKTSIANHLERFYGYRTVSLAAPLYEVIERLDPYVDFQGLRYQDARKVFGDDVKSRKPEVRRLLQLLGTEILREIFDPDILLAPVLREVDAHPNENIVVPDVRFYNEVDALQKRNALLIRVVREDMKTTWPHRSETELTDDAPFWHYVLYNRSTLDALYERVDSFMQKIQEEQPYASISSR